MKKVPTFTAHIYVGLQEQYTGQYHQPDVAKALCQQYVDEVKWCVTFTETEFIYTEGNEPGLIIGMVNYPRFPSDPETLKEKALKLAEKLLIELNQFRVSVVFPDETVMLESSDYA